MIVLGALFYVFGKIPWFGRLPGDIVIRREGFTLFLPVATMLLVSIFLSIIFNLVARR